LNSASLRSYTVGFVRLTRVAERVSPAVWLTAVALVVLHLAGLGHLVFARHGICPEHGEMIELGAAASHPELAVLPGGSGALSREDSTAAEHAHCPVFYGRRDAIAPAAPVVRVLALHPPPVDLATPSVWPPDFSGRLGVAPKQSPPAA
jgi:hypothetical protein